MDGTAFVRAAKQRRKVNFEPAHFQSIFSASTGSVSPWLQIYSFFLRK